MINREHKLPVTRQCELLGLARSTAYYEPLPVSEADLMLMRRVDESGGLAGLDKKSAFVKC